jgi:hypothetical protein
MMFDKDTIKEKLRAGNCTVVFTKADGTERSMLCTLQENSIPHQTNTNDPIDFPKKVKQPNPDVLAVWDIEKQAWRSFRYDAIKQFV